MRFAVLGSGSGGNCLIIESNGCRLLIDAGFSGRRIKAQLSELGEEVKKTDALALDS